MTTEERERISALADRMANYGKKLQNGEYIEEPGLGADCSDAAEELRRLLEDQ